MFLVLTKCEVVFSCEGENEVEQTDLLFSYFTSAIKLNEELPYQRGCKCI